MTDGLYIYRDALWLPDDHTFTDSEIEQMKQQRFDRWISIITAPPVDLPQDLAALPAEEV